MRGLIFRETERDLGVAWRRLIQQGLRLAAQMLVEKGPDVGAGDVEGPRCGQAGVASRAALVRVVLSASGGTPVMPLLASWSSDSAGVMYGAGSPPDGTAGYHKETISSRAVTPAAHGSGREASVRCKDVVPTGHGPVGSGRHSVGASPASAEAPMPPIITGRPRPAPSGKCP
jgi:hypothetical protein